MQDLTWIKVIFENYKKKFSKEALSDGHCTIPEHKYKTEAADELLTEIKTFIKEANKIVESQRD